MRCGGLAVMARCWLLIALLAALRALAADGLEGPSHLDRIRAGKVLRACIWPDYHGVSYRNPRTGQVAGLDADLAREFARDLGVTLRFVDSSPARLGDDLAQDRCDLAATAVPITAARLERLRFTRPHLQGGACAITAKDNPRIRQWGDIDHKGVVVAVLRGAAQEALLRERLKGAALTLLESSAAVDQELAAGRADVYVTDYPGCRYLQESVDGARLLLPDPAVGTLAYGWALLPGDDRWYARVEYFMGRIKSDGRLMTAARRHKLDAIALQD